MPVPPSVVMLGVEPLGPLTVKPNVPSPPVAFLTILSCPWAVLLKVQVTVAPAVTVKLVVDPPPQVALVMAQPAVTASLMVYVPAGTLIVVLPLPVDVVTLGEAALVPLTVKSNVPFAPMVFLTILIWP